jgi:hypothetical protein
MSLCLGGGMSSDPVMVSHVGGYCYACGYFGVYVFRVAMNGQLRTGTDKGNPTV